MAEELAVSLFREVNCRMFLICFFRIEGGSTCPELKVGPHAPN